MGANMTIIQANPNKAQTHKYITSTRSWDTNRNNRFATNESINLTMLDKIRTGLSSSNRGLSVLSGSCAGFPTNVCKISAMRLPWETLRLTRGPQGKNSTVPWSMLRTPGIHPHRSNRIPIWMEHSAMSTTCANFKFSSIALVLASVNSMSVAALLSASVGWRTGGVSVAPVRTRFGALPSLLASLLYFLDGGDLLVPFFCHS